MIRIAAIFLCINLALFVLACARKNTPEQTLAAKMLDTIQYGEAEYNLMRDYFRTDTLIQRAMHENIAKGDTSAQKIEQLLATSYDQRHETGLSETDIDALMLSFYSMQSVLNKFDKMQQSLDSFKTTTDYHPLRDSSMQQLDSLNSSK